MLQTVMFEDNSKERLDNQINKFIACHWLKRDMSFNEILVSTTCNKDGEFIHTALLTVNTNDDRIIINGRD